MVLPARPRRRHLHSYVQELCRHRSITTTLNEYGGLFESLHEGLADRLEETIQLTRAGQMRDQVGTNVVELHM